MEELIRLIQERWPNEDANDVLRSLEDVVFTTIDAGTSFSQALAETHDRIRAYLQGAEDPLVDATARAIGTRTVAQKLRPEFDVVMNQLDALIDPDTAFSPEVRDNAFNALVNAFRRSGQVDFTEFILTTGENGFQFIENAIFDAEVNVLTKDERQREAFAGFLESITEAGLIDLTMDLTPLLGPLRQTQLALDATFDPALGDIGEHYTNRFVDTYERIVLDTERTERTAARERRMRNAGIAAGLTPTQLDAFLEHAGAQAAEAELRGEDPDTPEFTSGVVQSFVGDVLPELIEGLDRDERAGEIEQKAAAAAQALGLQGSDALGFIREVSNRVTAREAAGVEVDIDTEIAGYTAEVQQFLTEQRAAEGVARGRQSAIEGDALTALTPGGVSTRVTPQDSQTAAFLQQQTTGLTPEERLRQQANITEGSPLIDESVLRIVGEADPAFAAFIQENLGDLEDRFRREEAERAEVQKNVAALQTSAVAKAPAATGPLFTPTTATGIPSAGAFAPGSFADFLSAELGGLQSAFQGQQRRRAQQRRAAAAKRGGLRISSV